ncbi:MAG: hypothetical protein FWH23_03630 [Bacteroidales bacterium]|nr:hypothetical protein [Bacteroidales bacterium]MCL2097833.1 hypothetical protein [Bacteroidales bacterium]
MRHIGRPRCFLLRASQSQLSGSHRRLHSQAARAFRSLTLTSAAWPSAITLRSTASGQPLDKNRPKQVRAGCRLKMQIVSFVILRVRCVPG